MMKMKNIGKMKKVNLEKFLRKMIPTNKTIREYFLEKK